MVTSSTKKLKIKNWGLISIFFLFVAFAPLEGVETLSFQLLRKIPHSPLSFTQGLAVEDSVLYESTGNYGHSTLQAIDLNSGSLLKQMHLPSQLFGEGIAIVDNKIIQLTWKEEKALVFDKNTLDYLYSIPYTGEGWGLCQEGSFLWMSDGTSFLSLRNSSSFSIQKKIEVTMDGKPVTRLNDLECVGSFLYANVWKTEEILRIDKLSGQVNGRLILSSLLSQEEKKCLGRESVLNGMTYNKKNHTFLITGKNWPWIYEIVLHHP